MVGILGNLGILGGLSQKPLSADTVRAKTLGKSVLIKKRTFDQIRGALLIKFGI